jgi:hypothetical protein
MVDHVDPRSDPAEEDLEPGPEPELEVGLRAAGAAPRHPAGAEDEHGANVAPHDVVGQPASVAPARDSATRASREIDLRGPDPRDP